MGIVANSTKSIKLSVSYEGTDFSGSCDDINYRKISMVAYTFIRSH